MLVAILTDVHANREALDACLADALAQGAERFVFLGDVVGYGADPAYCTDRIAECVGRGAIAIRGNHDHALATGGPNMNAVAREAILWTRTQLAAGQRDFLTRLPLCHREGDILFVHSEASAPERWHYVTSQHEAWRSMAATDARLTLCGHVHRPQLYGSSGTDPIVERPVGVEPLYLAPQARWLGVVGAVGQPRDGDPRACFALYDPAHSTLVMRRVAYDIPTASAKILAAGLPTMLAERLKIGA